MGLDKFRGGNRPSGDLGAPAEGEAPPSSQRPVEGEQPNRPVAGEEEPEEEETAQGSWVQRASDEEAERAPIGSRP